MSNSIKKAAVCWHSDPSEAFLVGTKESLRTLAQGILSQLDELSHESKVGSVNVQWAKSNETLTESGLDIVLDGLAVVASERDTIVVVNELRVANGLIPLVGE